jgi:hypothetical protein
MKATESRGTGWPGMDRKADSVILVNTLIQVTHLSWCLEARDGCVRLIFGELDATYSLTTGDRRPGVILARAILDPLAYKI